MILTERDTDRGTLVTVCDDGIVGETYEDGEISLTVEEEFYGGESVTDDDALQALSRASMANLVGVEAVDLAIEHGFVDEENVLDVDGTRHAQYLRL